MADLDPDSVALSSKLEGMSLESRQKEILQAMLGIARGVTKHSSTSTSRNIEQDFNDAFEPLDVDTVKMLLNYHKYGPGLIVQNPDPVVLSTVSYVPTIVEG